jgi:hypothetical protein
MAMKKLLTLITLLTACLCKAQDSTHINIGGEVRFQYFYFKNQDWGEAPPDKDGFILSRFLGHADLHSGKHFRAYAELQSSLADGQADKPSPVDQNPLDLHQLFIDYSLKNLTFRIGRQELSYGSQRLVAVREAPNNRQSFDGVKLMYNRSNLKLDLFYSSYVVAKSNIFDDALNKDTRLWGAYAVIHHLDIYYLGIYKKSTTFNDGKGKEIRHSLGARLWKTTSDFQYDIEGVYQMGTFNNGNIDAWTLSANLSYKWFGIKTEAISGDKTLNDNKLNTFNPLYPKGAYFGLAALIGPYNLIDAHPYIQVKPTKKLLLAIDYDLFWRMSRNDGLYAVNGRLLYANNTAKHIGKQLGGELTYTPNKRLLFRQEITWFKAGDYLKQSGPGKDILMTGSTITYRF